MNGNKRYEDNFGYYAIFDSDELAFFHHMRNASIKKTCIRCEEEVRLLPRNKICARCAEALEFGAPSEYGE